MKPARCLGFDSRRRVLKGYRVRRDSPRCIKIRVACISGTAPMRCDAMRRQRVFFFPVFRGGGFRLQHSIKFPRPRSANSASSCLTFFESPARSPALAPTPPSRTFFRSLCHVSRVFSVSCFVYGIIPHAEIPPTTKCLKFFRELCGVSRDRGIIFYRSGHYFISYKTKIAHDPYLYRRDCGIEFHFNKYRLCDLKKLRKIKNR